MRYIIIIIFITLSSNLRSQEIDSTLTIDCKRLYNKGLLNEARDCYLGHDTDIYAIYYAADISMQLDEFRKAKKISKKLISRKYRSGRSYLLYANLHSEDSIKFIQIITKGLKKFKSDKDLFGEKINFYIRNEDHEVIIKTVDKWLKYNDGDTKDTYLVKGSSYQGLGDREKALFNYKKSIELDPDNFICYYNIAVLHYDYSIELNNLGIKETDTNKSLALYDRSDKELEKSIPYFVKANKIDPENQNIVNTLKAIYYKLGKFKEYDEIER